MQMLTQLMKEAKRHQRTIVITLLDLRNAFDEKNDNLIYSTLRYHNYGARGIDINNQGHYTRVQ